MGNLLASDLNNPDYAGATNPDSRLAVLFYSKPMKNEFESNAKGRPIFQDMDFVKIFVPGDSTSVIDQPAREDHKVRFPIQWAHYQNKHGGDPREIGTPLSQWPRLTPSQCEELRALKFFTVESIAGASDQSLQKIGMLAGMSPYAFRDHAVRFLKVAQDDSVTQAAEERAKEAEAKTAELASQLADMQAQIAALSAPKRRGRKAKVATE